VGLGACFAPALAGKRCVPQINCRNDAAMSNYLGQGYWECLEWEALIQSSKYHAVPYTYTMYVFSGQSPALQVAYFSWMYWVVGTLLPLFQSAPTEFCPNTNEWRALPPSSNDEVAAITSLENSNKHLRKNKHLGKNQIKSLYSVMQGCSACVAGFLATWFMLCCCKMPISLYCCIKVYQYRTALGCFASN